MNPAGQLQLTPNMLIWPKTGIVLKEKRKNEILEHALASSGSYLHPHDLVYLRSNCAVRPRELN